MPSDSSTRRLQSPITVSASELKELAQVIAHDVRGPLRIARLVADRLVAALDSDDRAVNELTDVLEKTLAQVDEAVLELQDHRLLR